MEAMSMVDFYYAALDRNEHPYQRRCNTYNCSESANHVVRAADYETMKSERDQSVERLERIRVAFQALRDGREHASSQLYRTLAAEFPASGEVK
jgi:uncharacterized protein (DUF934 family)